MELIAEPETDPQPKEQRPEPPKTLAIAKQELNAALKKFKDQVGEVESNEKRLAEAKKEEGDLLEASMDEEQQVDKLSKIAALQRLLERKLEQGRNQMESAKSELRHAAEECLRSFWPALTELRAARSAKNLSILKELVSPEKWPYAETHALTFLRFAADLITIEFLGDQAARMLRGSNVQQAAEAILLDVAKLEAEARQ
jgi:hypothetical protein